MNVKIRKLTQAARIPTYATEGASGFDLYAAEDVIIAPGETKLIPTGLAFEIPAGYEVQIRPRSGVTLKTKLRVQLGTIDADYRGEVGVIVDNITHQATGSAPRLRNLSGKTEYYDGSHYEKYTYVIRAGDRIAQGVIAPVVRAMLTEINEELTQTERGAGGFGSTGVSV